MPPWLHDLAMPRGHERSCDETLVRSDGGLVATLLASAATAFAQNSIKDAAAAAAVRTCTPGPSTARATVAGKITDSTGAALAGVNVSAQCGSFRQDTDRRRRHLPARRRRAYVIFVRGLRLPDGDAPDQQARPPRATRTSSSTSAASGIITVTAPGGYVAPPPHRHQDRRRSSDPQSVSMVTFDEMADRSVQTINRRSATPPASTSTRSAPRRASTGSTSVASTSPPTGSTRQLALAERAGLRLGRSYLIQEIDVVKGPSSVLYGRTRPAAW